MKKIILLTSFVVISIFAIVSCNKKETLSPNSNISKAVPDHKLRLYKWHWVIVIGQDTWIDGMLFNCWGNTGFCKAYKEDGIAMSLHTSAAPTGQCWGGASRTSTDELIVYFQKAYMPSGFQAQFASNGTFTMSQTQFIPEAEISYMGFTDDYTIPSGTYNYDEDSNYYTVYF